jgi:hypothetical protein
MLSQLLRRFRKPSPEPRRPETTLLIEMAYSCEPYILRPRSGWRRILPGWKRPRRGMPHRGMRAATRRTNPPLLRG